jgi:hypothetical protein
VMGVKAGLVKACSADLFFFFFENFHFSGCADCSFVLWHCTYSTATMRFQLQCRSGPPAKTSPWD